MPNEFELVEEFGLKVEDEHPFDECDAFLGTPPSGAAISTISCRPYPRGISALPHSNSSSRNQSPTHINYSRRGMLKWATLITVLAVVVFFNLGQESDETNQETNPEDHDFKKFKMFAGGKNDVITKSEYSLDVESHDENEHDSAETHSKEIPEDENINNKSISGELSEENHDTIPNGNDRIDEDEGGIDESGADTQNDHAPSQIAQDSENIESDKGPDANTNKEAETAADNTDKAGEENSYSNNEGIATSTEIIKENSASEMPKTTNTEKHNIKPAQTTSGQSDDAATFVSPNKNGVHSDWGGVGSLCDSWDEQTKLGKHVSGVLFDNSDWMCYEGSLGNKLGLYFQARTFALLHSISFQISPNCSKENDSIISWLPQSIPKENILDSFANNTPSMYSTIVDRMCKCGDPIAHQCTEGWPRVARRWSTEIRSALSEWALFTGKPTIEKGAATIHFRCGDILDPDVSGSANMGFLKSSLYAKHLKGENITTVHILTTPLDSCKKGSDERIGDCKWGSDCAIILDALVQQLSNSLGLLKDQFHIHDHESTLWGMHHIVFSDISFCSPSTFCFFASMGSNHVIHAGSVHSFPAVNTTLPELLSGFEYDGGDYFMAMKDLPRNNTVEKVVELIQG